MHADCWIQQVTTRVGAVTCLIQQSVSPKQVVGFTCAFNSAIDQLLNFFIVPRSNPDGYAITIYCMDDYQPEVDPKNKLQVNWHLTRRPRSQPPDREVFLQFFHVFGRFRKFSDAFGPVRMCSDVFGCISVHWEAFRHFWKFSVGFFGRSWCFLVVFVAGGLTFTGVLRLGLTFIGANYWEVALTLI